MRALDPGRCALRQAPLITVFTPTYNRRHTLPRTYASLRAQTSRDFEWLVIDDGSEDGTEELFREWTRQADFPIRYLRQEHGGKHLAFNLGFQEARGDLFLNLDSDDECLPDCLQRVRHHWERLPDPARYGSLLFLVRYDDGPVEGTFPHDDFDASLLDLVFRHRLLTDYRPVFRTDVLRPHRFERVPGAVHVLEGTVFLKVARRYLARGVNDCLFNLHRDPRPGGQLTTLPTARNAAGFAHYHAFLLNEVLDYLPVHPRYFLLSAAFYTRFSWLSGQGPGAQWRRLRTPGARLLWLLTLPLAALMLLRHAQQVGRQPATGGQ